MSIPKRNGNPKKIVLGYGVFFIDDQQIGLTRDGGTFSVEKTYREITADGDRGKVKGRVVDDGASPKLQINHLEVLNSLDKLHPSITKTESSDGVHITGNGKINDTSDYHEVKWCGETKDGQAVTIIVKNAINLENISWDLKDKGEIIDSVTFEGCYEENPTDEYAEPWEVIYPKIV